MTESSCQYNKIYVIQSLNTDEPQTGKELVEKLEPELKKYNVGISFLEAATRLEFLAAMDRIWKDCTEASPRVYPIIHLETHGFGDLTGISIRPPKECVTWADFAKKCRAINVECHNNLLVTTGLCHGLHAITDVNIREVAPFFALVGPEKAVTITEVRAFVEFYKELLEHGDINKAIGHLTTKVGIFLAERLFFRAFTKYLKEDCKGQGHVDRVESLLAEFMEKKVGHKISEDAAREIIMNYTKPNRDGFEVLKTRFLIADHPLNKGRFDSNVNFDAVFEASERSE